MISSAHMSEMTQYVPARQPWLRRWCLLHAFHIIAIERMDEDMQALRLAPKIADAKYKMWLASVQP